MATKRFGKYTFTKHKPIDIYPQGRELSDVYGYFSCRKYNAYNACRSMCDELDGRDFCIVSHNTNVFCVAFQFADPDTGEVVQAYITPTYNYYWYL